MTRLHNEHTTQPVRDVRPGTAGIEGGDLHTETWSMRDALRFFSDLPVAEPVELIGRWNGEFIGRPALVRMAHAMTVPTYGWCGKEITEAENLRNLVRRHGAVKPSVAAKMSAGLSRFDGRPVVTVNYAETAPFPVSRGRAEMRSLSPDTEVLGLLIILTVGQHYLGPFPYRLRRSQR